MAKKLVLNEEACTGCGTCASIAPNCFELDDSTEKAKVISETACPESEIQEAIDTCPEEAIAWEG